MASALLLGERCMQNSRSLPLTGDLDSQTVAFIQLTPEEAESYRECPVYLDFHSGFYIFPVRITEFYVGHLLTDEWRYCAA